MLEDAADLAAKRGSVLAFTRRPDTGKHRSTVAALPVLRVTASDLADPLMLSKKPAAKDSTKSHAGHQTNLLPGSM